MQLDRSLLRAFLADVAQFDPTTAVFRGVTITVARAPAAQSRELRAAGFDEISEAELRITDLDVAGQGAPVPDEDIAIGALTYRITNVTEGAAGASYTVNVRRVNR